MLVLCGKSGTGKTTVANILKDHGYRKVVTYTTRPMRDGEKDGADYFFLSEKDFLKKEKEGFFAETAEYDASWGHCYYGSSVESYNGDGVIILNPHGVKAVINSGIAARYVMLTASDAELTRRLERRGDSNEEIQRRLEADRKDFAQMELSVDEVVYTDGKTPCCIAEEIEDKK